jgi:hypothetical protein
MSPRSRTRVARQVASASTPIGLAAIVALSCGCGSAQTEPVENEPAAIEPGDASPGPDSSSTDGAAPEPTAPAEVSFHQVVHHAVAECEVSPMPGGAVILCGSLVAMVRGDELRQDAAWLTGMTEVMAWLPERLRLELPPAVAEGPDYALPDGAVLELSTGNRNGPAITQRWGAGAWTTVADGRARDPRIAALGAMDDWQWLSASLPTGHLFVVRHLSAGPAEAFAFEPGASAPASRQVLPLPSSTDAWATLGSLVAASPGEAFLCTRDRSVVRYRDGTWAPMERVEGTIESCAATADGTLWVTTDDHDLVKSTPSGSWEPVPHPDGRRVQKVAASGERLWVVSIGSTDEGGGTFVYSTAPVKRAVEIGYNQTPYVPSGEIAGLDAIEIDLPSVGASPPGPGTSACTSLVLFLGRKLTPALRARLGSTAESAKLEVVQVAGTAAGKMVWPEGDGSATVVASTRKSLAVAVVPASYDEGQRLADLLAPNPDPYELPENPGAVQPRLLCAIPRVVKSLGPVGDRRIDLHGRPCPVTPYTAGDPCPGYRNAAGQEREGQ